MTKDFCFNLYRGYLAYHLIQVR